jgi:hypothetical protein
MLKTCYNNLKKRNIRTAMNFTPTLERRKSSFGVGLTTSTLA